MTDSYNPHHINSFHVFKWILAWIKQKPNKIPTSKAEAAGDGAEISAERSFSFSIIQIQRFLDRNLGGGNVNKNYSFEGCFQLDL